MTTMDEAGQIVRDVRDLVDLLDEVTTWLEGSDAFMENHGAHSAAVEARKLLARVKGD